VTGTDDTAVEIARHLLPTVPAHEEPPTSGGGPARDAV